MPQNSKKIGQYPNSMVILSLSIALFLIGLCGLISFQAKRLSAFVKENIELQVYLNKDLNKKTVDSLQKVFSKNKAIAGSTIEKPSVTFKSKDDLAKEFIDHSKEKFTDILAENPLRDVFLLKVKDEYFNEKSLKNIKGEFSKIKGVYEVSYAENLADDINKNIRKIYIILSGFVLLLLLTTIVLVNNTIKLAVFSQRFLIRSMQLVGATDNFIQFPFLKRGAIQGAAGAIVAIILLVLVQLGAFSQVPDLLKLHNNTEFVILAIILLFLGVATGLVCTFTATYKYLRLSLEQLYA
jgi:cell division transport system permease protein